jgi:hypothetical protein
VNPWPIPPLGTKDLDFAVVNYDFTGLTAGELGSLPPLEAAMDLDLFDIAKSIADQTVLIASMDGLFDDAANIPNEVGNDDFDTVRRDLSKSASAGDSLLKDYLTLVTPSSGGGGGGTAGPNCQAEIDFVYTAPVPVTVEVKFNNPTDTTYHVKSKTFTQDTAGVFTESDNIPDTLPSGGSWKIDVTYTVQAPLGTSAKLTVETDAPNSPNILCVALVATIGGSGGTGGTGGGRGRGGGGPRR